MKTKRRRHNGPGTQIVGVRRKIQKPLRWRPRKKDQAEAKAAHRSRDTLRGGEAQDPGTSGGEAQEDEEEVEAAQQSQDTNHGGEVGSEGRPEEAKRRRR